MAVLGVPGGECACGGQGNGEKELVCYPKLSMYENATRKLGTSYANYMNK